MGRKQLSGTGPSPFGSDKPKGQPVAAGCRLGVEPAEERPDQIRVAELCEVGDRRT